LIQYILGRIIFSGDVCVAPVAKWASNEKLSLKKGSYFESKLKI
jgi:hypothetical protein